MATGMAIRTAAGVALLLAMLAPATAFAGRDEAEVALTAARANVASAERADAAELAPVEYDTARDMLARAEGSYDEREWDDVEEEAQKAKADARLAEARARQRRAEEVLPEAEAAIATLRAELSRQGG